MLTNLNFRVTKLGEPYTRPPSCTTPKQPTIKNYIGLLF